MTNQSEPFGRLLRGAINSIAAYEGKSAAAIEEELGAAIGISGAAIQRYKSGFLPPEPRTTQILAEAAVRRGFLSRVWLQRFLQAARYPSSDTLLALLSDPLPAGAAQASELPSGTLTFLFTDIAGSTTRWEHQPQAMERALARHDDLLRQAIDAYGGHVVKAVGDAFQAVFTTVPAALDAALAAQRALASEPWGPIDPIRVRMALHVGSVQQRDGDYFGAPLNRIARLCAAGHGGQVLLSLAAQELVRDMLPKGTALRNLGEHRLKDLIRPERIFQVTAPDLPTDFPALRTLDSYRHNLPPQATPLIGREAEVATACQLLRNDDTHLLTLTGPGGTGKTRLALQAAAELLDDFRDGVFFVPLAPIRDPQFVAGAIAQALGIKEAGDQPLAEHIKAYLREKHALLLLDNFEQVAVAAPLVAELLAAAPRLKAIVTSRETLHLYGEHEYAVPPLSLPDLRRLPPIERLTQYEAVRLFIERAQAVRVDFAITTENAPAVAEICARLDGLPLAIELAAARSKLFPPKAMLARLDKRLALLTGGARDLPARQQTLRDTIAWSYDLLDAAEQAIFARLGVFVGGCSLAAAEAVAGDAGETNTEVAVFIQRGAVLDGLSSLVDKSLLRQIEGVDDEPRFVMLETIREFALERLAASGEEDAIRQRHAAFFLALAEQAELQFHGPHQRVWLDRIEVEHDNLRAALAWSLEASSASAQSPSPSEVGLRLVGALCWFWEMRGHLREVWQWLERTLAADRGSATPGRIKALVGASHLVARDFNPEHMKRLGEEMLELARQQADTNGIAWSLWALGFAAVFRGDFATAHPLFEESLAQFRSLHDTWGEAQVLTALGFIGRRQGDLNEATTHFTERLALARTMEDPYGAAFALGQLGALAQARGDDDQAVALLTESLALHQELGEQNTIFWVHLSLSTVARHQGDTTRASMHLAECLARFRETGSTVALLWSVEVFTQVASMIRLPAPAVRLFGAARALRDTVGDRPNPDEQREYDHLLAAAREQLGEDAFAVAWAEGQAMTMEQAIAEALRVGEPADK
jgi:predicted ATPase/class 3 adenylate cyclase